MSTGDGGVRVGRFLEIRVPKKWTLIREVSGAKKPTKELLIVISYLGQLYGPLKEISQKVVALQGQLASSQRAFELLDEVPEVTEQPDAKPLERARGRIEFQDVSFS